MPEDRPDAKGRGDDVIRTPEEVASEKKGSSEEPDASEKEKKERAREEFNLNEADHRRNPHG